MKRCEDAAGGVVEARGWLGAWNEGSFPGLNRQELAREQEKMRSRLDPACAMLWGTDRGHTEPVRALDRVHDGRATAQWLLLSGLIHGAQEQDMPTLQAIASLQVRDRGDPFYGCSRWYREESTVKDTNAAFFIAQPLIAGWLLAGGRFEPARRQLLLDYFAHAASWFSRECRSPSLFYSNKIISDGAMAIALAKILNDDRLRADAQDFLDRWCAYTEQRGWGWGENMSLVYGGVILQALWLILSALDEGALRCRIAAIEQQLVDNLLFHAPMQMVPSIRSYNFSGEARDNSGLYQVLGAIPPSTSGAGAWLSSVLYGMSGICRKLSPVSETTEPMVRRERVFDQVVATTYRGKGGRLGTVSRFPVMGLCYQGRGGGLGWQSMPVACVVGGANYGYLQWQSRMRDGRSYTHPADDFHRGYQHPPLFDEDVWPEMFTTARQAGPLAICHRTILNLSNELSRLSDQWYVPRFAGRCFADQQLLATGDELPHDGWIYLVYPGATLAIRPLMRLAVSGPQPQPPSLEITWRGQDLILRQDLYAGEARHLSRRRVESGWVFYLLDGCDHPLAAARRTAELKIEEAWDHDGEVPRIMPDLGVHRVRVRAPDAEALLHTDPLTAPRVG